MDDDIVRILISTDNHLGFAERDPVRCNDSFAAFEEVLLTAKDMQADLVLLGGDVFHENKPSRRTMHTAVSLLRKYCLGDDPVYTEVLQSEKEMNYDDPFQDVSLPVFSIHGNHDDPSREGGLGESLSAMDILAASKLVNYFGKTETVENAVISPILLKKGPTHVALYGLGAVRDERLHRMWQQKKVKFQRPLERDDFLNIFVVHQNRDYGRGSKNCLHESMIPEWMDIVVWGNEHECQPQLSESLVGTFRIYQPGSSVATSFVEGESLAHPKGMGMLEIRSDKKFRLRSVPFTQVRPFLYGDVALSEVPGLDPSDPKVEEKIKTKLTKRVRDMVKEAREHSERVQDAHTDKLEYRIMNPEKVLIRLRVEHTGFPAMNTTRFGAQFVGEVANPSELIICAKKKREAQRGGGDHKPSAASEIIKQMIADGDDDDAINRINIEDLVMETLSNSNKALNVLVESEMALALEDFVLKKNPNAIVDAVADILHVTQDKLINDDNVGAEQGGGKNVGIIEAAQKRKQEEEDRLRNNAEARLARRDQKRMVNEQRRANGEILSDDDEDANDDDERGGGRGRGAGRGGRGGRGAAAARGGRGAAAAAGRGGRGGAAAAGRGRGKAAAAAALDDDDDEEEDTPPPQPAARGGKGSRGGAGGGAAAKGGGRGGRGGGRAAAAAPAKKAAAKGSRRGRDDDDDEDDELDDVEEEDVLSDEIFDSDEDDAGARRGGGRGNAAPAAAAGKGKGAAGAKKAAVAAAAAVVADSSKRKSGRSAAANKKNYAEDDDDDEVEVIDEDEEDAEDAYASPSDEDDDDDDYRGGGGSKGGSKSKAGARGAAAGAAGKGARGGAKGAAAGAPATNRSAAAAAGSKRKRNDDDDEEDVDDFGAASPASRAPAAKKGSSSASAAAAAYHSINLTGDDDNASDIGFLAPSASAVSSAPSQATTGGAAKRRQLPLSFSQASQSGGGGGRTGGGKPGKGGANLTSGWD